VAGEGRTHEGHLFLLRLAAAMGPTDHRSRFALPGHIVPPAVHNFYREVSDYLPPRPRHRSPQRGRVASRLQRLSRDARGPRRDLRPPLRASARAAGSTPPATWRAENLALNRLGGATRRLRRLLSGRPR
jgi:hypothetical protein